MLKILQARLQQYVNREFPDVQAGFGKGRGTRDQIANICWIIEKAREFQKNIYFCFIDYAKAFDCGDHNKLWKFLQEMGTPDHFTCLLRNLYAGQKATVRMRHGTMECSQIGKGVCQGCILSPCLFNLYAEYIMWNAGLDDSQEESRLPGGISITSDMQMTPPWFDPWVGKILWRRKWQPTPVLLPGKSHGWRSMVGYSPWGCKELDTTERLHFFHLWQKEKRN